MPGLFLRRLLPLTAGVLAAALAPRGEAACCYFSAKDKDIQQPGQKVFITWYPQWGMETFTVQPKFEGNAADFGMVIPTPSKPKLDEMPRDFFKGLAVFTILKNRQYPQSNLLWIGQGLGVAGGIGGFGGAAGFAGAGGGFGGQPQQPRPPAVRVVESGLVGSLDYKIIQAERADDLYKWLKDHKYHYAGDEAVLDFYIRKQWFFTVMKIDAMQMKRKSDGTFDGEVTPTRFAFKSDKLVYPLKITQISVKDKTEALFYVQAPYKVDLPGDLTYQYQWLPMLQNARGWYNKGTFGRDELPGQGDDWLKAAEKHLPDLMAEAQKRGFAFANNQRPAPNQEGRIATTLEWARKLTAHDIAVLRGQAPFSEKVPSVDLGFTAQHMRDPRTAAVARKVIQQRLEKSQKERPGGYLVRAAPAVDVQQLRILTGHLQEEQFLTKFRKTFTKAEMDDDLLLVPAQLGGASDVSEDEEILPTSPP